MGENGAGKSTLMKIIAGVYAPDEGEFRLRGQRIRLNGPLDALENGIAMIHQELNLMPFMTVAENIWIRREPKNRFGFVDHGELRRRTEKLFADLSIDIDPEVETQTLSIASRQMVEIAKAVSYQSDVLIMDEPSSALTDRARASTCSASSGSCGPRAKASSTLPTRWTSSPRSPTRSRSSATVGTSARKTPRPSRATTSSA